MEHVTERSSFRAIRPLRALRALVTVMRDPENTAAGARMVDALSGNSSERYFVRFASDPRGSKIISEGRRLEKTLSDVDALMALPERSLGREYAEWMRAEGLTAEGLREVVESEFIADRELSEQDQLISARGSVSHDLWHVVTGYGRDMLGEVALLHFTKLQVGNYGLILPMYLSMLQPRMGPKGWGLVKEARRRARRAVWLPVQDWEELLPRPLEEVREVLRLGAPPRYTPVFAKGQARAA